MQKRTVIRCEIHRLKMKDENEYFRDLILFKIVLWFSEDVRVWWFAFSVLGIFLGYICFLSTVLLLPVLL